MNVAAKRIENVALLNWWPGDGIARALQTEIQGLGYCVLPFLFHQAIPANADLVISFAPYDTLIPVIQQLAKMPADRRPLFAHWNFEGIPNMHVPLGLTKLVTDARGWLEIGKRAHGLEKWVATKSPLSLLANHLNKYSYHAQYLLANRLRILDLLVETSNIYVDFRHRFGLQAIILPWGSAPEWAANDNLSPNTSRDIDVLWMGKRRTRRRSLLLDKIRSEIGLAGVKMYVADGVENPFIYEGARSAILRRTKITLNLLPEPNDNNFPFRFHIAAINRSMVLSEAMPAHNDYYQSGKHYVATKPVDIAGCILTLMRDEEYRESISENAWQLVTQKLTLKNSAKGLIDATLSRTK